MICQSVRKAAADGLLTVCLWSEALRTPPGWRQTPSVVLGTPSATLCGVPQNAGRIRVLVRPVRIDPGYPPATHLTARIDAGLSRKAVR